jgi:hypothetical protein
LGAASTATGVLRRGCGHVSSLERLAFLSKVAYSL